MGDLAKKKTFSSAQEVAEFLAALHPQTRGLFKEVKTFVELCLCLPVSAASSERSFFTLRRLKLAKHHEPEEIDTSSYNAIGCTIPR